MDVFDLINKIGLDILKPIAKEKKYFKESNTYINSIYSSLYNILNETIIYPKLCLDKINLDEVMLSERRIDIEFSNILFRKNKNLIYYKIENIRNEIFLDNEDLEGTLLLSLEKAFKDVERYFVNYEQRLSKINKMFSIEDLDSLQIKEKMMEKNKNNIFYLKKDYEG